MNHRNMLQYKEWISFANVVSCISVVILHTNSCFWRFSYDGYWISANIIESVFYFAVPVFFMITGATLISYRQRMKTKEYFVKRIYKTLIPFIVWSVIAVIYKIAKGDLHIIDIGKILVGCIDTSLYDLYWFFPILFSIYLCIPFISAVKEENRINVFTFTVVVGFFLNNLVPFIIDVFKIKMDWPYSIGITMGYFIYPLVGYLISEKKLGRHIELLIIILSFSGLVMSIVGTYILSYNANRIVETYKGYCNVPCILYSVGVFVLLKKWGGVVMKNSYVKRIVEVVSPYTFAIYLMHMYVLKAVRKIYASVFDISYISMWFRIGAVPIIIIICIIVIKFIRKIPILNTIVPR